MLPILYSFRRCPYAIRARLALQAAQVQVVLREVVLRDKPDAFLRASPSGTVPCLVRGADVIDESIDVMLWALRQNDPNQWLRMPAEGWAWIERCDGPFKLALDRTKYTTRYPGEDPEVHRARAITFLSDLDAQIEGWIFERPTLADFAILPFVRQFAFIDKGRFDAQHWPHLQAWLARFLTSEEFAAVMHKYRQWQPQEQDIIFPDNRHQDLSGLR
jgi:glutathione S-transferase